LISSNNNNIVGNTVYNNEGTATAATIHLDASSNNIISRNITFGNVNSDAIMLTNNSNNNILSAISCESGWVIGFTALKINASSYNIISGSSFGFGDINIMLTSDSTSAGSSFNNIYGNLIYASNTSVGAVIYSSTVSTKASTYNIFLGNAVWLNYAHGLGVAQRSSYNLLSGNFVYDNGTWSPSAYDGIRLVSTASNNLMGYNRIGDSQAGAGSYGININAADCANNFIVSNFIDGFSPKINDIGIITKYTDESRINLTATTLTLSDAPNNKIDLVNDLVNIPRSLIGIYSISTVNPLTVTISNGKYQGDILILVVAGVNSIKVPNSGNIKLQADRILDMNDTLKLIWNGSAWIEIGYSKNIS